MKEFMDEDFMLDTPAAVELYHRHAEGLPIVDFHCHLDPAMIAADHRFDNLGELWLCGDHYKWRAMRANGVAERYITGGDTTDREKFDQWAATVPWTMRNPLYHWTHLELKTAFGVTQLLGPDTAREIYDRCTAMLRTPEFSARGLMRRYGVEVVCTTDDPTDSLEHHAALRDEGFEIRVLPTWRPDRAMAIEDPASWRAWVEKLSDCSGVTIDRFEDMIEALRRRHDFFESVGCRLSDHGIDRFWAEAYTASEIDAIFTKLYDGRMPSEEEAAKFRSAVMFEGTVMDFESGWTQQFHYGALRNNSTRLARRIGPDAGGDSIGDGDVARSMSRFLDRIDKGDRLARTIIYNLNPRDNDLVATMAGNFQDGTAAGKIQFGAAWWFLDQRRGMKSQLNSLSAQGLLGRFVGMVTDSRSFLSYPRHEYFRRTLCNLVGEDVDRGLLPRSEMAFLGEVVESVSYHNAKNFLRI